MKRPFTARQHLLNSKAAATATATKAATTKDQN
jgi:hypothetical protein